MSDLVDAENTAPRFLDLPGHELLQPATTVKASTKARLDARLLELGLIDETGEASDEINLDSLRLDAIADLIDFVSANLTIDPNKFDEFTTGAGGMKRTIELVFAYINELGKGEN